MKSYFWPGNVRWDVAFRPDNTKGFIWVELAKCVAHIEPYTDEWYEAAKRFAGQVARR
ncbi:MAG: hypothetical protein V3W19_14995 [Desulfatiglandales bacterium]